MKIRREVQQLLSLGPLPIEGTVDIELIKQYELLIQSIEAPLTSEEINMLVTIFGPDNCYGLAWTLLNIIEATPGWSAKIQLNDIDNEWIQLLLQHKDESGKL